MKATPAGVDVAPQALQSQCWRLPKAKTNLRNGASHRSGLSVRWYYFLPISQSKLRSSRFGLQNHPRTASYRHSDRSHEPPKWLPKLPPDALGRSPVRPASKACFPGCSGSWPNSAARARGCSPEGRRGRLRPPPPSARYHSRDRPASRAVAQVVLVMAQSSGTRSRVYS